MIGIYAIKNKLNEKIYVGKSANIELRFTRHRTLLKHGKHSNKHLQRAYLKYGKENFEYILIEECESANLPLLEQKWIDKLGKTKLYNHQLKVIDLHNERNPFFGKKHSIEAKAAMSIAKKKAYVGSGNPNYGKKNSKETLIKISEGRGRLNKEKVLEIVTLLKMNMPHQEIADKYDIARTAITRISNGTRWTNVTGGPVVPVIYVDGKRQLSATHRQHMKKGDN